VNSGRSDDEKVGVLWRAVLHGPIPTVNSTMAAEDTTWATPADVDAVMAGAFPRLIATALERAPLVRCDQADHRSRMILSLDRPLHGDETTDAAQALGRTISAPLVDRAARAISRWAFERSSLPHAFYREVTVRVTRSCDIQLKFILSPPQPASRPPAQLEARERVWAAMVEAEAALEDAARATAADDEHRAADRYAAAMADAEAATAAELRSSFVDESVWDTELSALVAYLASELPSLRSVLCQLARGRPRPAKTEPCCVLWGSRTLTERWPGGAPFQVDIYSSMSIYIDISIHPSIHLSTVSICLYVCLCVYLSMMHT